MKKIIIGILMVGLTTLMAENLDSNDITTWEQVVTEVNLDDSVIEKLESDGITPKMYLEYKKIYPVDTYIYVVLEIIYKDMPATSNKSLLKSIQDNYSRKNTNFNRNLKEESTKIINIYNALNWAGCKSLEPRDFSFADEYNNKDKCYTFATEMSQRLDENSGITDSGSGRFFATFKDKGSWKNGQMGLGLIKGLGAYKYKTATGAQKTIPNGRVLMFYNY
jgi:hypothetical protein